MNRDLDLLRKQLQRATNLSACAQTVCDHLVAMGFPLPSVYLVRSGRLRCFGASGYFQVRDGFPPLAGIISATVRSGEPHVVEVRTSDIYLPASDIVEHEVCVPIFLDGSTVGAVNIESPTALPADTAQLAATVAAVFATRMAELGGIPQPTGWQFVADQATRLVDLDNEDELFEVTLDTALALSGADTGMVVIGSRATGFTPAIARGVLADELAALSQHSLAAIGEWMDGPLSVYTVGAVEDEWFPGSDALRRAGLGSVVVTAINRGDEQLGYIMVTDRHGSVPATETVEQMELLGSLASSALSNARHLASLRDMTRRDPLTGLGHHVSFGEALHHARHHHASYAVLAIDVDHFKHVNDNHGHEHGDRVLRDLAAALGVAVSGDDSLFRIGGDEFAAIVAVDTEDEALAIAQRLSDSARQVGTPVSIGVAFNRAHEPSDLYTRADEALYVAKRLGRDRSVIAEARAADGEPGSDGFGGAHGSDERHSGASDA